MQAVRQGRWLLYAKRSLKLQVRGHQKIVSRFPGYISHELLSFDSQNRFFQRFHLEKNSQASINFLGFRFLSKVVSCDKDRYTKIVHSNLLQTEFKSRSISEGPQRTWIKQRFFSEIPKARRESGACKIKKGKMSDIKCKK